MLLDFAACKKSLASMNTNTSQGKILIPFAHSSCLLPDLSAGRIAREQRWTSQEFSSVYIIIPPWFSMLIYHLGDKQQACWWLHFRDTVSSHQDNHHHHAHSFDTICNFQ
jgi:hypothetical protein